MGVGGGGATFYITEIRGKVPGYQSLLALFLDLKTTLREFYYKLMQILYRRLIASLKAERHGGIPLL